jgi:hypothetical protein
MRRRKMKPTKNMQPELEVEKVPIDLLTPYANNAKKHSREQVDQIAKSIREFGNCDPIAVWTNPKGELEVVEGHGRLYALEQLGFTEVPVFRLDHLTDAQRRQYTHVHNQLTMNTGWDFSILQDEFDAMPGFEWGDFGFDFTPTEIKQPADTSEEIDVDDYSDEKFEHVCPKCGFRF